MNKLIVVDVQNDFITGSLAVKGADKIVPVINKLIAHFVSNGYPVIYTQDWHKLNHPSFEHHGGKWPVHCVAGSWGARFDRRLLFPCPDLFHNVQKGYDFEEYGADLTNFVRGSDDVFVCGIATDFCVRATAASLVWPSRTGDVFIVSDATVSVGVQAEAIANCVADGMHVADSKHIMIAFP